MQLEAVPADIESTPKLLEGLLREQQGCAPRDNLDTEPPGVLTCKQWQEQALLACESLVVPKAKSDTAWHHADLRANAFPKLADKTIEEARTHNTSACTSIQNGQDSGFSEPYGCGGHSGNDFGNGVHMASWGARGLRLSPASSRKVEGSQGVQLWDFRGLELLSLLLTAP